MPSQIRNVSLFPYLDDLNRHRLLIPLFQRIVAYCHNIFLIDPASFRLISSVDPLFYIPCSLLSIFSLRYCELLQINLTDLTTKKKFLVLQEKVNTSKEVDNTVCFDFLNPIKLDLDTPLICCTYTSLCSAIKKAQFICDIKLRENALCATHFFRHAWASWANYNNLDKEKIRARLGHTSLDSLDAYINSIDFSNITF